MAPAVAGSDEMNSQLKQPVDDGSQSRLALESGVELVEELKVQSSLDGFELQVTFKKMKCEFSLSYPFVSGPSMSDEECPD
jgi:hypothetical protein